jgi:predicted XRE-type DNA-binding protein
MSAKKKRLNDIEYVEGSDNVFADLGIPEPEEAMAKAKLAMKIYETIKTKKLNQAKAAKVLKISQPKVSLLLRGYLTDFSLERLLRFLNDLGQDVYISIVPSSHGHGNTWVGERLPIKCKHCGIGKIKEVLILVWIYLKDFPNLFINNIPFRKNVWN